MVSREQPGGWRGAAAIAARIAAAAAEAAGHVAAFVLLLLTIGIVLGITLRWIDIDNSWTYDFVLFTLVWVAFLGAVFTARRDRHVTAGIALEHIFGGRGTVLSILRFAIVGGFLVLFAISGYRDVLDSFQTGKTTIDVVQWKVWIAEAALPVGAVLWLVAEAAKFLRRIAGLGPESAAAIDSTDLAGE